MGSGDAGGAGSVWPRPLAPTPDLSQVHLYD